MLLALAVLLVAVLAGCGDDDPPSAAPADGAEEEEPITGTRVVLVGDSIMRELADSLTYGVEAGGEDGATFVLGPTLPRTAGDLAIWRSFLEEHDPDVVVLQVGHWERLRVLGDFATGDLLVEGSYREEIVDPALDLLEESGTRLVWVSPIPVSDPEEAEFVESLADDWRAAVEARSDGEWLDVSPVIAPDGFVAELPGPDGTPVPVRRSDGIHMCPEGQRRVAAAVVDDLRPLLTAPPPEDWDTTWVDGIDEPGGCAPYED